MKKHMLFLLIAGGVLLLQCEAQQLNCADKFAMQQEQMKCFEQFDIGNNFSTSGEIQYVVHNDPAAVCSQQDKFQGALTCALDIEKSCLQAVGVSTDILPDADKMGEGMSFMCNHITEMDPECMKHAQPAVQECAMRKATTELMGMDTTNVKDVTCAAFKVAYDCMKDILNYCTGRTLDISLELTNKYIRPAACSSFAEGKDDYSHDENLYDYDYDDNEDDDDDYSESGHVKYHFTTIAPMTTVQLLTTVNTLPEVRCYSESGIWQAQQECLEREGLYINMLQDRKIGNKQILLDSVLANSKNDIKTICREKIPRQRALACMIDVQRRCMPVGYQDYLPGSRKAKNILDELCDNHDEVDFKCAVAKASELFDCRYKKDTEEGPEMRHVGSTKGLLCNAFRINVDCHLQVLPVCGCMTTNLYVKMHKEMNPPACPLIHTAAPKCKSTTYEFAMTDGGLSSFTASGLSSFTASVVTVMLMVVMDFMV